MYGGNGKDTLIAGDGADYIDGGNDIDTANYSRSTDEVIIDTTIGKVLRRLGARRHAGQHRARSIGTAYDDHIAMGDGDNRIWAAAATTGSTAASGDRQPLRRSGNDTLNGGSCSGRRHRRRLDRRRRGLGHRGVRSRPSRSTCRPASTAAKPPDDTFISIEQFNGSAEADTMVASNAAGARFAGGDGVDTSTAATGTTGSRAARAPTTSTAATAATWCPYADAPHAITVDMYFDATAHTDGKIIAGEWGMDTLVSIENVEGTAFADYMIGDERSNKLLGARRRRPHAGRRRRRPAGIRRHHVRRHRQRQHR